ncbi:hypothetical protein PCHCB_000489400, partial [Plasmodium chabaudi chabaudi]
MNKNIYSLVTVVSYILSIVTTQCFTNNEDLNTNVSKNENVHNEYEINSVNINNNGKFRCRSLSEHSIEDNSSSDSTAIQEPSDKNETETASDNDKSQDLLQNIPPEVLNNMIQEFLNNKETETADNKEAETTDNKEPETADNKEPETADNKEPGTADNKEP